MHHRGPGNDPPDCQALDFAGNQIGIEITELVDSNSAAAARREQNYDWKDWREDLIPALDQILRKKNKPAALKGGPYSEYVLVIYSDEPWLELKRISEALAGHSFPATSLITRSYLLISYDPPEKRYPLVRFNIDQR